MRWDAFIYPCQYFLYVYSWLGFVKVKKGMVYTLPIRSIVKNNDEHKYDKKIDEKESGEKRKVNS